MATETLASSRVPMKGRRTSEMRRETKGRLPLSPRSFRSLIPDAVPTTYVRTAAPLVANEADWMSTFTT